MNKLALLVLNDLVNDSRVLKEAYSLSKLFEVHIFALNSGNLPKIEILNERIYVHRKITYVKPINIVYKKISQIVAYLSFLISSVFYIKKFQGVHCNDLETLPVGYVLKFLNRDIRLIYDAHEYETETLWMKNKLKKRLAKFFEGLFLKRVDLVITVSDSIAEAYVKDYGIKRPAVVLNAPRFKEVKKKNLFRIKFPIKESQTIFLYQGGFSEGRGIDILIDTFKKIKSNNAVIVFMGFGPLLDKIMIASKYSKNIFFHEAVNQDELIAYTSSADVGILFYENTCLNHYYCSPNKMFEYIMAEIPVICSNLHEMKKLVLSNKIGVVSKSNDSEGLESSVNEILFTSSFDLLRKNVINAKQLFCWEKQELILINSYNSIFYGNI